ncbi:hypothetical protein HPHPH19_0309 [Helicobacter pylori Hp H-19]|nr:hypothetical protein HPHPH19_0309 [Helicobacter pylori Hp H-19]
MRPKGRSFCASLTKSFGWIFKSVLRGSVSYGGLKGYSSPKCPPIPLKEWFSLQIKNTH